jgi:penicillin-binding protein 1A
VRTSLDPRLQAIAVKSLRDGLVAYDERHGWRGVMAHIALGPGWDKRFADVAMPDGAEVWKKALVVQSGKEASLVLEDGTRATLTEAGFKWTHKAAADDLMKPGDVVLVEQITKTIEVAPKKNKKGNVIEAAAPAATETFWGLQQMPAISGALVAMDPHTGRVLAMVGGLSASPNEFNRATQAQRQPGSSFKPFVYMAALDKGFTPSTIVVDGPISLPQGPGLPMWQPVNYEHDFLGPQPLRVGVEKSRNAMTVRIAEYIGMPAVVDMAKKFGILDNPPVNFSLAIGSGETTLMRMVTGYSMIVNGGVRIQPTLIDRIQDREGKTVYRQDNRACQDCTNVSWVDQPVPIPQGQVEQVEDPRTTFQMTNIMEGVVQRGTASVLSKLPWPLAGKTGTTNESKDVWFIGFTPDLTVGVFVGYDQPKSLGKHETGASTAVPIFGEFMKAALADQPPTPFRIPPGVRMVRVNPSTGQPDFGAPNAIWEAFIPGNEPGDPGFIATGAALAARLNGSAPADSDDQQAIGAPTAMPAGAASNADEEDSASDAPEMPLGSVPQAPQQPMAPAPPSSAGEGTGGLY